MFLVKEQGPTHAPNVSLLVMKTFDIKKQRRFIFLTVMFLSLFGLIMVYESSSIYAYKISSDPMYFFSRQLSYCAVGVALFIAMLFVDLDFLRRNNKVFLAITIILLFAVLIVGKRAGGARRWFHSPFFNFQPSEMLKITFLVYCAEYCRRKGNLIRYFRQGLLPLGLILGVTSLLLLLEPDLGSSIFWVVWTLFFLFLHRARKQHIFLIVIFGVVLLFFLITLYPYRFKRITAYFNPYADPRNTGFQIIQSQIAFGEGGLWGVGLGEGRQKLFFLPAAHTDFIFSIIAEEFGLWGSLSLFALFFFLINAMVGIAQRSTDEFRRGLLWGIIFIFFLEVIINIGVSCGLFPTKGLPLPFMSYGGSNLITHFILLGLFFNASKET
ncbi:MAG: putative lipid II flippase FtsW [Candidatus Omnitrophota bacterium]|nr:putative lipid II flippase FtsW [Candidatus Omnitrophota bacterium]